ncbi:MAG: hypothetical protein IKG11_01260 [Atopobiaceae bacterium]|nr:hypothetical protein [Atopobiaceae bacterium]
MLVKKSLGKNAAAAKAGFVWGLLLATVCYAGLPLTALAFDEDLSFDQDQPAIEQVVLQTEEEAVLPQEVEGEPAEGAPLHGDAVSDCADGVPEPAENVSGTQVEELAEGPSTQTDGFAYQHDPRKNPSAMADIIEDKSAVYGFSPSPTGSLKQYVSFDWSDPAVVEAGRQQRIAYHNSFAELYDLLDEMKANNASPEQTARAVSTRRNELRMASVADDPEELAKLKQRNLEQYGNENGGTPEFFYEKYGSWEKVIEKSFSVNSGMDACTGLYDDYFDVYVAAGQVPPDPDSEPEPEPVEGGGDTTVIVDDATTPTVAMATPSSPTVERANTTRVSSTVLPATGDQPSVLSAVAMWFGIVLLLTGVNVSKHSMGL